MDKSLRKSFQEKMSKNPQQVIDAFEKAGVKLTPQDITSIRKGDLGSHLEDRINSKILGMIGINSSSTSRSSDDSSSSW